jgi:hypothetical protein
MATPKLNALAKRFMQQIQDPISELAGVIIPGQIIRSVADIESYLGMAMQKYIEGAWLQAKGDPGLLLRAMPELYKEREATVVTPNTTVDLSATHADIFDILDSRQGTTQIMEAWNPKYLTDALTGLDPFHQGDTRFGGLIYNKPILYIFPTDLAATVSFVFTLCFIQAALNPLTGEFLVSGGAYDIPFAELHYTAICDIAEKLYKIDDYQEDAG